MVIDWGNFIKYGFNFCGIINYKIKLKFLVLSYLKLLKVNVSNWDDIWIVFSFFEFSVLGFCYCSDIKVRSFWWWEIGIIRWVFIFKFL